MKLLTIPGVAFSAAAYLNDHELLSIDFSSARTIRRWDLGDGATAVVPPSQATAAFCLFRPEGAAFLREQGFWPADQELPTVVGEPAVLWPRPGWSPSAFGAGGTAVIYAEVVVTDGYYSTRFHVRTATSDCESFHHARGYFGVAASFSADGNLAAVTGGLRDVVVYNVATGGEVCRMDQSDNARYLSFVGRDRLAVAAGRTVRLWDVPGGACIAKLPAFHKHATGLAVSPDHRLLAACGRDGRVTVCEAATGHQRDSYDWQIGELRAVAFSPAGSTAAVAGQKGIVVWDLE
ncbi:WD40 repeat domain-containing protein [Limnoglobus roseus]|uniref:WD-40 repeat protein n=1 Tax=Limnoglobus roseus TaxID=2598579 RepID=A0A5C1A4J9_9BACT|nr:hypothetical protein [Limnoglobus roseus]QEL14029.1 WD-40 repeat protein [Limnoglobus roseus]